MPRQSTSRGKNQGIKYEEHIHQILRDKNLIHGTMGGTSSAPDMYIKFNNITVPLEIKKDLSADFAQIELRWNDLDGFFYSTKTKNNEFKRFLSENTDFLEIINKKWIETPKKFIKSNYTEEDLDFDLDNFPDIKITINSIYIEEFYTSKIPPINYIQVGKKGFYYLKENTYSLNADRFSGKAVLRARVKTRSRSNLKWGFLVAIKLKELKPSRYDLEEQKKKIFPFTI